MVDTIGKVKACCVSGYIGDANSKTINEIWNNDKLKKLRVDMLAGDRNSLCHSCYSQEDNGVRSSRLTWVESFKDVLRDVVPETKQDGTLDRFELRYMDIRFNNLCNFKCRTCNPIYSSKIAVEKSLLGINSIKPTPFKVNSTEIVTQFKEHYPYIQTLYFAGGEPLIQAEHWDMIEDLIKSGRSSTLDLLYSTNGSTLTFKGKDIIDYWSKFKSVLVQVSIDAMGIQAEYWRDGTIWEDVINNIKRAKTCPNVVIKPHGTIGWPNVLSWTLFVKYAIENKLCKPNDISVWFLENPREFSLQAAPGFKKEEIKNELENLIKYLQEVDANILSETIKLMIKFMMKSNKEIVLSMLHDLVLTDNLRGKNFLDYFPEHENMKRYLI
jgi:MoaA/NifB/PqqE/SkfB family radical SAM enzyme